jgi:hypothetical protein
MKFVVGALVGALMLGGCAQLRDGASPVTDAALPESPPYEGALPESSRSEGALPESSRPEGPVPEASRSEGAPCAPTPSDTDRLLAYFARADGLPAAELARERESARRAMVADASEFRRLRYAMVLSVSIDDGPDAARVIELVDPIARRRDSPYHALALMLRSLLSDMQRMHADRTELRRKLDSIKTLEKTLSDREEPTK